MITKTRIPFGTLALSLVALLAASGCAKQTQPGVKKVPANQEFSGFLKDYSNLKPNPKLEGKVLTYAKADAQKNLHKYIAIVVDPVEVYLASDADDTKIPEKSRAAAANYMWATLVNAVADTFPVVDTPGPLVLRLRTAIIGVDAGSEVAAADKPAIAEDAVDRGANISKVGIEIELLDSETGEQIAAMVDREPLGDGAEIAAGNISRSEKSAAARAAFDEWASRVKEALDAAHELSKEDVDRVLQSYQPYGSAPATK
jgi:hypothetical protein